MNTDRGMYRWREMSAEEQAEALQFRQRQRRPWHGPPHFESDTGVYLVTAACYEHHPIIGASCSRMAQFEAELLESVESTCRQLFAWVVLPNHYHFLVDAEKIKKVLKVLGMLHGRTSYRWNLEDESRGRKVWHRAAETAMKSERHFWVALNYILNNPVLHGYVEHWQDWPYSNASSYLAELGRDEAERRWRAYPVLDFGKEWDPPEL